jgi:UDP-N-acetylglucosamine--N-acetylmuramyl-(pentapeptide) pyrophosphoryl-undecaprenol N-acetylglucosamine transferase
MMKRIILTGGGSAGHVTPNLALIPELRREGWDISYIGTAEGIERELITPTGIQYYTIAAGKLRRYRDLKNLTDPFRVLKGIGQAFRIIKRLRPNVVFSKGGFVAVPVVVGAWLNRVPVVAHESDLTPGLANKLSFPFVTKICATFPETVAYLPRRKGVLTGSPIRPELLRGNAQDGLKETGFAGAKPVLLAIGGSLGAAHINEALREALPDLQAEFDIIHICGKGKIEQSLIARPGYRQYEYVRAELADLLAAADLVVSRAGANFLFELLALKKPTLLIPLPKGSSRGDQILNAASFQKQGFSMVLPDEALTAASLTEAVAELYGKRKTMIAAMEAYPLRDGVGAVMQQIKNTARNAGNAVAALPNS